jgi:hypothetical protein
MKKIFFMLALAILFTLLVIAQLPASEVKAASEYEVIVNELVKEKVITQEKADEILAEIKAVQEKAAKESKPFVLPDSLKWLEKFKFTGDFRLRYQYDDREDSYIRHRARIRFRFGTEVNVIDDVKVFAGIATGSGDPRSTNQTLDRTFEHPTIRLDYAYAQYKPLSWLTIKAGQMRGMPFWTASEFVWDSDINPGGAALQFNYHVHPNINVFFNSAFFVIAESAAYKRDPYMYVLQPGFDVKIVDGLHLKTAITYYGFEHVKGKVLVYSAGSNTGATTGLMYNYDSLGVDSELGLSQPLKSLGINFIPYVGLFGEYVYNPDPPRDNNGFLVGMLIGDKSITDKGQWQAKYQYRYLQRDAFLDTFPDSDAYGGATNVAGHEVIFQYGLFKHVILGTDYYYTKPIKGYPRYPEHIFQGDILFTF